MKRFITCLLWLSILMASPSLWAADKASPVASYEDEPIQPLESAQDLDPEKVELGRRLFNDTKLSGNQSLSCAFCHKMEQGGALNLIHAPPGASGKSVPINVPTFLGSSLNFAQFWDGRAASLEDQMDGPINNPDEMGTSWAAISAALKSAPDYSDTFYKIYHAPPTEKTIKAALVEFEKSQLPVNSQFDLYLKGDKTAISTQAQTGYDLFKNLGCTACHQGQNVGGNMFQKFGIIDDYFAQRGNITEKDYGRYNVTKQEEDRYVFKVPSLRNVALTAPYFHDGSAPTLEEAVDVMAKYQLGRELSTEERAALVEFLKTLTGKLPDDTAAGKP